MTTIGKNDDANAKTVKILSSRQKKMAENKKGKGKEIESKIRKH